MEADKKFEKDGHATLLTSKQSTRTARSCTSTASGCFGSSEYAALSPVCQLTRPCGPAKGQQLFSLAICNRQRLYITLRPLQLLSNAVDTKFLRPLHAGLPAAAFQWPALA